MNDMNDILFSSILGNLFKKKYCILNQFYGRPFCALYFYRNQYNHLSVLKSFKMLILCVLYENSITATYKAEGTSLRAIKHRQSRR